MSQWDTTGLDTIGKRIAQARRWLGVRERADIPPAQLAERLGVPTSTVTRWENDERSPDTANLFRLADKLGVDPRWLQQGTDLPDPNGNPPVIALTRPPREAIDAYNAEVTRKASRAKQGSKRKRK